MPRVCAPRSLLVDSVCACLSCVCVCVKGELRRAGRRQQREKLFGPVLRPAVLHHTPGTLPKPHSTHPHLVARVPTGKCIFLAGLLCSHPARSCSARCRQEGTRGRGSVGVATAPSRFLHQLSSDGAQPGAPWGCFDARRNDGGRGVSACSPPKSG